MNKLYIFCAILLVIIIVALLFGRGWLTKVNDSSPVNLVYNIDHSFDGEVIIIGAGAAGLAAANSLKRHGIRYTILEATDHYGGRVQKDEDFADFPIDLGAEWIHHDATILNRLIGVDGDQPPAELIRYNPSEIYNWDGKSYTKISEIGARLGQWSFPEYKFKNSTWFDFVDKYFARNVKDKIVFNAAVTNIDYAGDKIAVGTQNDRVFTADKVIVTVSTGVLQKGYIGFTPALDPERMEAINAIEFLSGFKLFMKFDRDFYADIMQQELEGGDKTFFDAAFGKDTNDHILTLLVTGEVADQYYALGDEDAIVAAVLKELDEIYDGQATSAYLGNYLLKDWGRQAFTMGTWTHDVGDEKQMELLTSPVQDKVYFAGGSMERNGQMGTVHGAIMSGYQSVFDILERYPS